MCTLALIAGVCLVKADPGPLEGAPHLCMAQAQLYAMRGLVFRGHVWKGKSHCEASGPCLCMLSLYFRKVTCLSLLQGNYSTSACRLPCSDKLHRCLSLSGGWECPCYQGLYYCWFRDFVFEFQCVGERWVSFCCRRQPHSPACAGPHFPL